MMDKGSGNRSMAQPISLPSLFWHLHLKNSLASYGGMCYKSQSLRKKMVQTGGVLEKREWP